MMMRLDFRQNRIRSIYQQRPQPQLNRASETRPSTNNNQNMPFDYTTWIQIINQHEEKLKTSSTTASKSVG
tara:strand:- start:370 stop:582 length:213 start_codon:yes stop_codon:yes gene_type:complete